MTRELSITEILLANFQANKEGSILSEEMRRLLGLSTHYKIGRLALGRSMGEPTYPDLTNDTPGRPLKGNLLFGEAEVSLWVGLLITNILHYNPETKIDLQILQNAVKRHWSRGVRLLKDDWISVDEDYEKFIEMLITRRAVLPDSVKAKPIIPGNPHPSLGGDPCPVTIKVGEELDSGEAFTHLVNGVGYSPHMAIMGQVGSGKTRTMLEILRQIREQTNAPVILLDLGKGELAKDLALQNVLNATVLEVPDKPIPLDMFYGSDENMNTASDAVLGFRDSFCNVMQSKPGAKQLQNISESLKPLFSCKKEISLRNIKIQIDEFYQTNGLNRDIVTSTIYDLNEREIFSPDFSPKDFFSKSWIITFANARETSKNFATALLLDALSNFLKRSEEAPKDNAGYRAITITLAIDEARDLLALKHKALSENIRLHRSKGLVTMLSSQSPDDYDGKVDDYLENIGLPICFTTNATSNQVLQNMFTGKPNFASLQPGICMTLRKNKMVKVKVF